MTKMPGKPWSPSKPEPSKPERQPRPVEDRAPLGLSPGSYRRMPVRYE